MIAFIGGTSLMGSSLFQGWARKQVKTPFGSVILKKDRDSVFLQRHGAPPLPPHRINHRANVWALKNTGADAIIAINSVGSLKLSIKPGSFLIPDDFISFCDTVTFYEEEMKFTVPLTDTEHGNLLFRRCKAMKLPVKNGGVYIQTRGPRLETKAEIRMLKRFGDVVGMTMASEATLCIEYGMPYTSLCSIDNYCNGIIKTPLTMDEIQERVKRNLHSIQLLFESIRTEGLE